MSTEIMPPAQARPHDALSGQNGSQRSSAGSRNLIIGVVVALVLVAGAGFFAMSSNQGKSGPRPLATRRSPSVTPRERVSTMCERVSTMRNQTCPPCSRSTRVRSRKSPACKIRWLPPLGSSAPTTRRMRATTPSSPPTTLSRTRSNSGQRWTTRSKTARARRSSRSLERTRNRGDRTEGCPARRDGPGVSLPRPNPGRPSRFLAVPPCAIPVEEAHGGGPWATRDSRVSAAHARRCDRARRWATEPVTVSGRAAEPIPPAPRN